MPERVWRKENTTPTQLVEMQTSSASMENSMEVPQKTENTATIWSSNPTRWRYLEKNKTGKDTRTALFIASLFTITKTWRQPKYPLTEE